MHDLSDCAIASVYCDESKAGPAEILAVIPAHRRSYLRDEFAFEFLAIYLAFHHAYRLLRDPRAEKRARRAFARLIQDAAVRD